MCDEVLVCSVDDFLEHLAPFTPDAGWIESARNHLKTKGLLVTPAKTTRTTTAANCRSPRVSSRARASAALEAGAAEPEVNVRDINTVKWEAYRNAEPKKMEETEMEAFKPLEEIVNALLECPDPDSTRRSNGYCYKECRYEEMVSETMGPNCRVDAVVANPNLYKTEKEKEGIAVAAAQTAVVIEFTKYETADDAYENQKQLVSAVNHIMNDDPRRNWMYGITIENTNMSLWYFSRSFSMKSAPIDFTKNSKRFICTFLSFLYASDEELGHDPSVYRRFYNERWCYIYELHTENGPKYYRAIEPVYTTLSHYITSRKSRVWKVAEVSSLSDLEPKPNTPEIALKDCWVDAQASAEKEIQRRIFERLAAVEEASYAWAPEGLRGKLKEALVHPQMYFMEVVLDQKLGPSKGKPQSHPDSDLLLDLIARSFANMGGAIASAHNLTTTYISTSASQVPPRDITSGRICITRYYDAKQHYRVVYAEVGKSLAHATSLSDAVRAFEDIFVALTLLFLAGWVHRDIGEGNINLVCSKHGVRAKMSDLEYAQCFGDEVVVTEPKTGTPYFMPIEIHKGLFLFPNPVPASKKLTASMLALGVNKIPQFAAVSPILRYNFAHDLESLWWIMVWIIIVRIKDGLILFRRIFAVLAAPDPNREGFFSMGGALYAHLTSLTHKTLCGRKAPLFLTLYNQQLCKLYASGNRQETASYQGIYKNVWEAMEYFVPNMSDVSMELEDPLWRRPPPPEYLPADPGVGKRERSMTVSGREMPAEAGSSRKKPKVGDVFNDANEGDSVEDGAV